MKKMEELTKMQIWEDYYEEEEGFGYLYREEEIKKAVTIDYDNYYLTGLDPKNHNLEELTEKYDKFRKQKEEDGDYDEYETIENLEEFFSDLEVVAEISACTDEEELRNEVVFNWNDSEFEDLGGFDELVYVSYLDGQSNRKKHINDGYNDISITEVIVVADAETCIDVWDGSNYTTGGIGCHEYINKVLEIDDDEVEDMWLVQRSSQWQGSRDTANVMTKKELETYLKDIGRDLEDYL
ncbi:MAG TPA: hypothetical protein GXZ90_09905 [Clostridiales bacterium]|nr:hypothetical protein [Clostridiales bacterium]